MAAAACVPLCKHCLILLSPGNAPCCCAMNSKLCRTNGWKPYCSSQTKPAADGSHYTCAEVRCSRSICMYVQGPGCPSSCIIKAHMPNCTVYTTMHFAPPLSGMQLLAGEAAGPLNSLQLLQHC